MPAVRSRTAPRPIALDLSCAFDFHRGLGRADLLQFAPALDAARARVIVGNPPVSHHLLADYRRRRKQSLLGHILAAAGHVRDTVDRVVLVGPPEDLRLAEGLFAACCHPYHNELSRGQRGGRPRIYLAPSTPDNDRLAGLLDILQSQSGDMLQDAWTVVGINPKDALATATIRSLCDALAQDDESSEDRAWMLTADTDALPSENRRIAAPAKLWQSTSGINPGIVLAASLMGIDAVAMLRGAAALWERCLMAPVGDNPALDLAGACHLLAARRGIASRIASTNSTSLDPLARWFAGASAAVQDFLLQIVADELRRDPLRVKMPAGETASGRRKLAERSLIQLASDEADRVRHQRAAAGQPTAVLRLPATDEASLGQLIKLFSLATGLEQFLTTNP